MILLSWVTICFLGFIFWFFFFVCLCFTCLRNVWHWFFCACVRKLLLGASCFVSMLLIRILKIQYLQANIGDNLIFFLENEYSLASEETWVCFSLICALLHNTVGISQWNIFGVFLQSALQTQMYDYFYFFFSLIFFLSITIQSYAYFWNKVHRGIILLFKTNIYLHNWDY